jgi:predicted transcriptional regulator
MIGLQKVLEVFNMNPSKISNQLGVSRQTVHDWLKGKRKIPKNRITLLSQLPEFKYINVETFQKEINKDDEHDIQIANITYLAEKENVEINVDGILINYDLYRNEKMYLHKLQENKKQLNKVEGFLRNEEFIDELNDEYGVVYSNLLGNINHLFEEQGYEQINAVKLFIEQLLSKKSGDNSNFANDLKKVLTKHNLILENYDDF